MQYLGTHIADAKRCGETFVDLDEQALESLHPINGMVLLEREPEDERHGAIVLMPKKDDARRFEASWCRVIRTGTPARTERSGREIAYTVREGDRVIVTRFAGHDLRVGGKLYVMAQEPDILAVEVTRED